MCVCVRKSVCGVVVCKSEVRIPVNCNARLAALVLCWLPESRDVITRSATLSYSEQDVLSLSEPAVAAEHGGWRRCSWTICTRWPACR